MSNSWGRIQRIRHNLDILDVFRHKLDILDEIQMFLDEI
jgi:hypothetical protein